jgi:hypothetical protein
MQLSIPFQTAKGTYRLEGNVLEVEVPGKPTATFEIKREGRALTLTERSTGKAIQYKKIRVVSATHPPTSGPARGFPSDRSFPSCAA